MNSDFKDLLQAFDEEQVEYMVVGAYAVMHYAQPRYTKDIDLWVKPSVQNAIRVTKAFHKFGLPLIEVTQQDFEQPGLQYAIGMTPTQIDFLTSLPGLKSFDEAYTNHTTAVAYGITIHYLGRKELIVAKQTAGRPQDLADLDELNR